MDQQIGPQADFCAKSLLTNEKTTILWIEISLTAMPTIINTALDKAISTFVPLLFASSIIKSKCIQANNGVRHESSPTRWMGRLLSLLIPLVASGSAFAHPSESAQTSAPWYIDHPDVAAILVTGAIGLFSAWWSIVSARDIARKRAAMDAVMESRRDEKLRDGHRLINEIDQDKERSIELYHQSDCDEPETRSKILYVLNHYENVAVAIHSNIYDESIFKRSECTIIRNLFVHCKPLIERIQRHDSRTAYQELAALAEKWSEKPLSEVRRRSAVSSALARLASFF